MCLTECVSMYECISIAGDNLAILANLSSPFKPFIIGVAKLSLVGVSVDLKRLSKI